MDKSMPLDDLDLEFEDEEEVKRKKNEAVQVDVDLEFQAPDGSAVKPRPPGRPQPVSSPAPASSPQINRPVAQVKNIAEARGPGAPSRPATAQATPRVQGANALKPDLHDDVDSMEVNQLRDEVRRIEFDAQVKVALAEFKVEILGELLGDIKLMDHQVGQLLSRMIAKHPDLKQEALMIKKILADFAAKKRK